MRIARVPMQKEVAANGPRKSLRNFLFCILVAICHRWNSEFRACDTEIRSSIDLGEEFPSVLFGVNGLFGFDGFRYDLIL